MPATSSADPALVTGSPSVIGPVSLTKGKAFGRSEKKPKSRRCPAPPRGCRVNRCKTRSLYDVKISGHGSTRDRHGQTLLSNATYKARKYRNQPALAAGDRRPPRKRQHKIRPGEPRPTLPFRAELSWPSRLKSLHWSDFPAPGAGRLEVVEPDGIEPTTSCLQSRRSPS